MNEAALKQAKTDRRWAKSAFTRAGKAFVHAVEYKRAPNEVREVLMKLQGVYENLVVKHEDYTKLTEDDSAFETLESRQPPESTAVHWQRLLSFILLKATIKRTFALIRTALIGTESVSSIQWIINFISWLTLIDTNLCTLRANVDLLSEM